MNERIEAMRRHIDELNDAGVRTTLFYDLCYESLKSTPGKPVQLRRAEAQAYILDHAPLDVHPYELLAGSMTGLCPVLRDIPSPQEQERMAVELLEQYLRRKRALAGTAGQERNAIKTFEAEFTQKRSRCARMSRAHHDASIPYADLQRLIVAMKERYAGCPELEPYEIGRELERGFKIPYSREARDAIDQLPWFAANHLALNYGRAIRQGLGGILEAAEAGLRSGRTETREYYEAARLIATAAMRFITRYADALEEQSAREGAARRTERAEMARICRRVSAQPAASFREGLQLLWMLHIIMSMLWGSALSLGRFDQYMLELYRADIGCGALTREQAKELLCCLWLKVNEPRLRTVQSLTIGGVTPEGEDAANELTDLCLDVIAEMKLPYPNVGARLHPKSPDWLWKRIAEVVRLGGGQPMVMNDSVFIPALKSLGYSDAYANDYYYMGCGEIMVPGKQPSWGVTDPIAFPMLVETVFEQYRAGSVRLDTFADFRDAYSDALLDAVDADYREAQAKIRDIPGKCYDPLAPLLTDGCLEMGLDMFQGGSEQGTHWSFYAYGLGTAADAVMAVKKFVYDEKRISLRELSDAMANNFAGDERLRLLLERSPCYGNDADEVDAIARDILARFTSQVLSYNVPDGRDKYVATLFGYFFHIYHGEITGATPNGRKKGEPFSDSMGPSQGRDTCGPTKLLNSVLKLNNAEVTGGYALNLKLNHELFRDATGLCALEQLIRGYFADGGPQLQINFVDADSLRQAQKEPAKYRNLIVRIGGYCEYFVNLDRSLQDEIISRTIHAMG